MSNWVPRTDADLFTDKLSECNILATWTAESNVPNTLIHCVGANDYQPAINKLIQQVRENQPARTYVIAVSGPAGGNRQYFEASWYGGIQTAVMNSTQLSAQQKQNITWRPAEFDLLRNAPNAIKSCFALLQDGKYGASHHPPAPSTSSSSSSGSFGNRAPPTSRPGSSGSKTGSKTGSPAGSRPGSSSGKAPASSAAGKKVVGKR